MQSLFAGVDERRPSGHLEQGRQEQEGEEGSAPSHRQQGQQVAGRNPTSIDYAVLNLDLNLKFLYGQASKNPN